MAPERSQTSNGASYRIFLPLPRILTLIVADSQLDRRATTTPIPKSFLSAHNPNGLDDAGLKKVAWAGIQELGQNFHRKSSKIMDLLNISSTASISA